ncbi:molybdate ABC transporter substrate-binding protein [Pseudotabrizicola sediminis]|uniref:Molybdate ABC transporter substrate-binding protein n=1 Tax=Pseudotabrizicola sediminis TaxID=2486418 RepID=A0ABY2KI62_9RHOB|nr:molybdate ABC transporter substrate-binding protein [Pseudotabrizicola sediminis]TGD42024.1 molybdate ABC transporter substrate-binding protein [Pseudotabrizicola sediminis]
MTHARTLLACAASLSLAAPALAEEVVVFAAASLKTALDAVAADFQAATGYTVAISYAGSNALARQIIEGAPADIFLSSAVNWMDVVEQSGLLLPQTRRDLFGNALVLVGGPEAIPVDLTPGFDLVGLLGDGRLAMGMVESVPAGQYGKAALESLGLWEAVAPSVAQADNVRAALAFVSSGEAPYGIVYATDAVAAPGVTVVGTFPADSHPPILFPGALLTGATDAADAAFFAAITSEAGAAVFAAQGFEILN